MFLMMIIRIARSRFIQIIRILLTVVELFVQIGSQMKRNQVFLSLFFILFVLAADEMKNDETDPLSPYALFPFQQCETTAPCHQCTSQNVVKD